MYATTTCARNRKKTIQNCGEDGREIGTTKSPAIVVGHGRKRKTIVRIARTIPARPRNRPPDLPARRRVPRPAIWRRIAVRRDTPSVPLIKRDYRTPKRRGGLGRFRARRGGPVRGGGVQAGAPLAGVFPGGVLVAGSLVQPPPG